MNARRFKPYQAYKDSGVEWLEKIPPEWQAMPLKRIGELQAGAGFPDAEQGLITEEIPFCSLKLATWDRRETSVKWWSRNTPFPYLLPVG